MNNPRQRNCGASLWPPLLIDGEDAESYEEVREQVYEVIGPNDIIEQGFAHEYADRTWEISRLRRLKHAYLNSELGERLSRLLAGHDYDGLGLVRRWRAGDPEALAEIRAALDSIGRQTSWCSHIHAGSKHPNREISAAMVSMRKIEANRANARASTGPKTARGRAHSSGNALTHGLTRPVRSDPMLAREVERLAAEIAGINASEEVERLADEIAQLDIELYRVRLVRHEFISRYHESPAARMKILKAIRIYLRREGKKAAYRPIPVVNPPTALERAALVFVEEHRFLRILGRYEQRALSRRKFLIRALCAARERQSLSTNPRQEPAQGGQKPSKKPLSAWSRRWLRAATAIPISGAE